MIFSFKYLLNESIQNVVIENGDKVKADRELSLSEPMSSMEILVVGTQFMNEREK